MNVAITRARQSLVVLGNASRLSTDATWKSLVDHANARGLLVRYAMRPRHAMPGKGGEVERAEEFCTKFEAIFAPPEAEAPEGDIESSLGAPGCGSDAGDASDRRLNLDRSYGRQGLQNLKEDGGSSSISTASHDAEKASLGAPGGQHQESNSPRHSKSVVREEADVNIPAAVRNQHTAAPGVKRSRSAGVKSIDHSKLPEKLPRAPERKKARRGAALGSRGSSAGATHAAMAAAAKPGTAAPVASEQAPRGRDEKRRPKRSRSARPHETARRAGGNDVAAGDAKTKKDLSSGFLVSLLGSMESNASRIASGETHAVREGLRGGEVRCRRQSRKNGGGLVGVLRT